MVDYGAIVVLCRIRRIQQLLKCPVLVKGFYPTVGLLKSRGAVDILGAGNNRYISEEVGAVEAL